MQRCSAKQEVLYKCHYCHSFIPYLFNYRKKQEQPEKDAIFDKVKLEEHSTTESETKL
jgi:glutaredoxin